MCTIGDGAFQMLGMNGLITVKRHWEEWDSPTFIVLVVHNNDLNQVTWEMREAGDPRYDTSQLLEDVDYAAYAELMGLEGIRVERPEDLAGAWDTAFAADRPVVLDVLTDKNVPPLPAHMTFEQAKGVANAVLGGDPDAGAVVSHTTRVLSRRASSPSCAPVTTARSSVERSIATEVRTEGPLGTSSPGATARGSMCAFGSSPSHRR